MQKPHICLVCWDKQLAPERAAILTAGGFRVTLVDQSVPSMITWFRDLAPGAIVIDLDRLPSHGREIGVKLRGSKSTRQLPLVFLGGPPEKTARVRTELPDAIFTTWTKAPTAIREAIAHPALNPSPPLLPSEHDRAADLARRLDIKPNQPVLFWGDDGFLRELCGDPANTVTRKPLSATLCLCVTHSTADVEAAFDVVTIYPAGSNVWIIHPKQTSRLHVDFNQNDVRNLGLARGWVDYKVCSVDADWSALKFALRRTTKESKPSTKKAVT